ncbi:MAG TPA: VPLPA-CTERM sorting domain-containing protein [Methylophilus sp.]
MKQLIIAATLALSATAAQADVLSLATNGNVAFTLTTADCPQCGNDFGYTGGVFGQLSATEATTFEVTYLGKEAANTNFFIQAGSTVITTGSTPVGTTQYFNVAEGVLNFGFDGSNSTNASNTSFESSLNKIAFIADPTGKYAFIIGFNDSGSTDGDYDDLMVGVNAVPVPAALPLMASALGMFGVARRRKSVA